MRVDSLYRNILPDGSQPIKDEIVHYYPISIGSGGYPKMRCTLIYIKIAILTAYVLEEQIFNS